MRELLPLSLQSLGLLVAAAIAATGCFDPSFTNSLTCSQTVGCPDGLVCINNVCERRGAGQADSGSVSGDFSFIDDEKSEFDQGTYEGTVFSNGLQLGDGVVSGRYLSRVFDGDRETLQWSQFGFQPDAPFGVGLPDDGAEETGYRAGNINMTSNLLLLHCDDTIENSGPTALIVREGEDGAAFSEGLTRRGCEVAGNTSLSVPSNGLLDFGTGDYTWATWLRTTTRCEDNDVVFGADGQVLSPGGAHLWFGCARSDDERNTPECSNAEDGGYFSGVQSSNQGVDEIAFCGTTVINDGNWHHLAMVKSGAQNVTVRAYVDGRLEATASGQFTDPIELPDSTDFGIGFFPQGGFDTENSATIDELAVWSRALSAEEIQNLVKRAAVTVQFSVANCTDIDCPGPFGDETGNVDGRIVDPGGNRPPSPVSLEGKISRFFRYQVELDSIKSGVSPSIQSVSVSGTR